MNLKVDKSLEAVKERESYTLLNKNSFKNRCFKKDSNRT